MKPLPPMRKKHIITALMHGAPKHMEDHQNEPKLPNTLCY